MFPTTQDFVRALDRAGELKHVHAPVSPVLEIPEIADRVSKSPAPHPPSDSTRRADPRHHALGGHALLFHNVQGSDFPLLINAWGSYRRVELALGCDSPDSKGIAGLHLLADRIARLVKPEPPPTLLAKLQKLPELLELAKIPPRRVSSGLCQQVVIPEPRVDLTRLPLLRCWPLDGDFASLGYPHDTNAAIPGLDAGPDWDRLHRGRYITLGTIHSIHADDAGLDHPPSRNVGMYRVQLLGPRTLAMHWHLHHDGARHWRSWKDRGLPMPVAISLGGESVLPYAATAPMPPGISELLLAGFLNRAPIPLVRCASVPIDVPANSEIVIEGLVSHESAPPGFDPREPTAGSLGPGAVFEGPFGDHTGFYSLPDRYPIMRVTALTHRHNAIFPATIVGLPPQEDYYLGKATERVFLPLLKTIIPDILDYDLPMFGAFHNCAFISIRKDYPFHARRVMHAVWGAGQMSWTKHVVVLDHDVDVHDHEAVLRAVAEHALPARDLELVTGPLDILDHAAPFLGAGHKLGIDATRKSSDAERFRVLTPLASERCNAGPIDPVLSHAARSAENSLRTLDAVRDARIPDALGGWWLFVSLHDHHSGFDFIKLLGTLADRLPIPRWTIVLGPGVDVADTESALFHWMANTDPGRDRVLSICGRRVAFDATPKAPGSSPSGFPVRSFPPLITMNDETKSLVTNRWREYFPSDVP